MPQSQWRTPGLVLLAGSLLMIVTFGTRAGFGLFLAPMSSDLGWGREVFALAIAIQNLCWGACQPFAGALADRYGSGRTLALGTLLYAAGVLIMASTAAPLTLHLSAGVLVGLGLAGSSLGIVLAAVSRTVPEERRSRALGLVMAAGSLGQFLMVPLGQTLLGAFGWSTALLFLGLGVLLVTPLAVVLTGRPEETGPSQSVVDALGEAGRHGSYWLLIAGFFVCGFHVAFIAAHLPAYITDLGFAPILGAWALALVGLFNVVGSYSSGVLGGRYSKKYLLSFLYFSRAALIAVFLLIPPTPTTVLVFAAIMGLLWLSTVPLTSGLVAQMFGPRYMGMLFGIVFFSHQVGSFLGVWLGGYLFDTTGSYDVVWWAGVALGVFAGLVHWPIRETRVARLAPA